MFTGMMRRSIVELEKDPSPHLSTALTPTPIKMLFRKKNVGMKILDHVTSLKGSHICVSVHSFAPSPNQSTPHFTLHVSSCDIKQMLATVHHKTSSNVVKLSYFALSP